MLECVAAAVVAQGGGGGDSGHPAGVQGAWAFAKIGGRDGPDALEDSLSLKRARQEWANLPFADQLSLTQASVEAGVGAPLGASNGANTDARCGAISSKVGTKEEEDEEGVELIYDPNLGLYFDPKTNSFFVRDALEAQ